MNARYLVVGAIVGGTVLFFWGFLTHAALPESVLPMHFFKDEQAVVQVLRVNAPVNGVYFGPHGIFAAVAFLPDFSDKSQNITPNLLRQFASDTLAALLLAVLVAHLPGTVLGRAGWAGLAGITAFVLKMLPYWNWYGFSPAFLSMEALDLVPKFFLGALVLGGLMKKLAPAAAAARQGAGVEAR